MIRRVLAVFALWLAASGSAFAAAPPPAWSGVWRGTIGTAPVSVCLGVPGEYSTHAAYYYHSTMRTIALEPLPDGGWSEHGEGGAAVTGTWRIANSAAGRLRGEWQSGARKLPITLERVQVRGEDGFQFCGAREFLAARIRPAKLTRKPMRLGSFAYTALNWNVGPGFADVALDSFEFPIARPGDRAINAAVRLDPDNPQGRGEYLSCLSASLEMGQSDGDFGLSYEPIHASREFIGVKVFSGGYCGGAHPFHDYGYQTWDRASGAEVQLRTWFAPQAFERVRYPVDFETFYKATPAFARFLAGHLKFDEPECRRAVESAEFWEVGLSWSGMVFTPSLAYVETPCVDDAAVAIKELLRWLSPAGRAGVARLRR
jgi:hypothetical protein